jgi:transcriptional regulator of acetoin/glycerol metabolism
MRYSALGIIGGLLLAVSGCGPPAWTHPNKSTDQFAADWNRCDQDVARDPKLQQGSKLLMINATERCMMKKGWILKQDE